MRVGFTVLQKLEIRSDEKLLYNAPSICDPPRLFDDE
jgi:hypothetical protein